MGWGGGGEGSLVGSVLGSQSCLMQRRGFDPSLNLRRQDFFLGVSMASDSIPPPPPPKKKTKTKKQKQKPTKQNPKQTNMQNKTNKQTKQTHRQTDRQTHTHTRTHTHTHTHSHTRNNSFGREYKPRSSLCTHTFPSHGLKRSRHLCPRRMDAGNKKQTQHAPSTKTECDYLNGWIKKTVTYAKISPKMVNPRDLAGNPEGGEVVVVCWLLNVPATCKCISGTDLLRQFYVLPH